MALGSSKKIIIVGAGIVGSTLAWYLSRHTNLNITLVDKNEAALGVTQHSFAWLNVSYGRPNAYSLLRKDALNEWRNLDLMTQGKLNINWSGAISWHATDEETLAFISDHYQSGFNIRALDKKQLAQFEPHLQNLPNVAAFSADEGSVDPVYVTKTLLHQSIENGVNYLKNHEVTALIHKDARIVGVKFDEETLLADNVILTAGTGVTELMKLLKIDLPVHPSPSIIVHFNHLNKKTFVQHIVSTPEMELRPLSSAKILCAEDYISDAPEHSALNIAQNALSVIKNSFIGTESLDIEKAFIGMRPMPKDEMPIVGSITDFEGLYIVSMHAAITLAPLICRLAADEILYGTKQAALTPYRLTRFASGN